MTPLYLRLLYSNNHKKFLLLPSNGNNKWIASIICYFQKLFIKRLRSGRSKFFLQICYCASQPYVVLWSAKDDYTRHYDPLSAIMNPYLSPKRLSIHLLVIRLFRHIRWINFWWLQSVTFVNERATQ